MRLTVYAATIVLLTSPAHALDLKACGTVTTIEGETCDKLSVKMDLSACNEPGVSLVSAKVRCTDANAIATYRGPKSNFRAVLEPRASAWGKGGYELKGKVWHHVRNEVSVAKPDEKISDGQATAQNNTKERIPSQETQTSPILVAPTTQKTRPSDEELSNLVNLFSGFNFKGSVDTYYSYNSNTPPVNSTIPTTAATQTQNKYRVFDAYHDDLQVAFARLQIQKVSGPVTTTLDFGYGPGMQVLSGTKTDAAQLNAKQAIIGYKPFDKLNIEVGRFVTFVGYELVESQDNWNYSRNTLFGYFAPYWHQGAKVTYSVTDTLSVMAMVADGWNNSYVDKRQKTFGGQIAWTPNSDFSLYFNTVSGPEALPANLNAGTGHEIRSLYDLILTLKASEKLSFAMNAESYHFARFFAWGVATYAKYQFDPRWSLAARVEHIDDKDNLAMGETLTSGQKLATYTITAEDKITPNLSVRLEGRMDRSTSDVFTYDGRPTSSQTTGLLGIVAGF